MRKMGLDLGDVRIGIALSDSMCIIASAYETYKRNKEIDDLKYIDKIIKEKDVDVVVVGLPLNMDGTFGDRAAKCKDFADKLAEFTKKKVVLQDERLTTVAAQKLLINSDVRREKRKQVVDKVASAIILQSYLDCIK